ncbi:hypothetical protein NC651_005206 [Populus alba x Populus x berolinensis]|nr:hypothetical protein NC651_005203 [Populus alba x Populus x berolinensis]KAJ6938699.1 hypothetical protein NC651_005206 [Populus alba x Populus x berolinensis]
MRYSTPPIHRGSRNFNFLQKLADTTKIS